MQATNVFIAGFFLTFSFFKMLDLKGFAKSYAMYYVVAKKVKSWAIRLFGCCFQSSYEYRHHY